MSITIDCHNKIALVTGASGALGKSMALSLAKAGADVALHYFSRPDPLAELSAQIKALGRRCCLVGGDVGDKESVAAIKTEIEKQLGTVDIVVMNAVSQIHPWRTVLEESEERFLNQVHSCSLQALHVAQAFVPQMCANGWGRVIGISTECIMQLEPTQSAYVSAKRGMDGVLRILANEVAAQGVTVNQVAPGYINSNGTDDGAEGYIKKHSPMGRRATDQDVANCVAFLASDLARSMTGAWIPVSCGSVQARV